MNLKSEEEIYNFLLKPSLVLKNHNIFNKDYLNKIDNNYFNNQKVLGVHRRATDHFAHGIISSDEIVLNAIEEELVKNKYDKIETIKKSNIQKSVNWCEKYKIPCNKFTEKINIFLPIIKEM